MNMAQGEGDDWLVVPATKADDLTCTHCPLTSTCIYPLSK